jgi:hypothetical protein
VTPGRGKKTAAPQRPQYEVEKRVMPGKPAADRCINVYIDGYNFYVPFSRSGKESDYELAWCNFLRFVADCAAKKWPLRGSSVRVFGFTRG